MSKRCCQANPGPVLKTHFMYCNLFIYESIPVTIFRKETCHPLQAGSSFRQFIGMDHFM